MQWIGDQSWNTVPLWTKKWHPRWKGKSLGKNHPHPDMNLCLKGVKSPIISWVTVHSLFMTDLSNILTYIYTCKICIFWPTYTYDLQIYLITIALLIWFISSYLIKYYIFFFPLYLTYIIPHLLSWMPKCVFVWWENSPGVEDVCCRVHKIRETRHHRVHHGHKVFFFRYLLKISQGGRRVVKTELCFCFRMADRNNRTQILSFFNTTAHGNQ